MCVFRNFQGRLKDLSGLVQGIFRGVLKLFQGCFKSVSKVLKEVSNEFQASFMGGGSREFQGSVLLMQN